MAAGRAGNDYVGGNVASTAIVAVATPRQAAEIRHVLADRRQARESYAMRRREIC